MPRTLNFSGSSNVKTATLNDDGTAEVTFANGGRATYRNISAEMFDEWEKADSAGRWFHNRVRSKPTEYPMIAQVKDEPKAEKTSEETTAVEPLPPVPSGPIAASSTDAGAAIRAANAKIAALQNALEQANRRADAAEREVAQLSAALDTAKADAKKTAPEKRDFRPWRNR